MNENTIEKYSKVIQILKEQCINSSKINVEKFTRKHKVNNCIVFFLKKLGYLIEAKDKKLQWISKPNKNYNQIAIEIIDLANENQKKYQMKRNILSSRKKYSKKKMKNISIEKSVKSSIGIREGKCILYLKKLGYKILKPVNEYKEI